MAKSVSCERFFQLSITVYLKSVGRDCWLGANAGGVRAAFHVAKILGANFAGELSGH